MLRLPTNPCLVIPPHVFSYGIQVSLDKARKVVVDPGRRRGSPRLDEPIDQVGNPPPHRPTDGSGGGGGGDVSGGGGGGGVVPVIQQQVMETIRATICATVPVRGVPETAQERLGKRLVEDDERRPGWCGIVVFVDTRLEVEEGKRPVSYRWRGHRGVRSPSVAAVGCARTSWVVLCGVAHRKGKT